MKTVPGSCVLLRVLAESRDQQPGSYWLAAPPDCAPIGWGRHSRLPSNLLPRAAARKTEDTTRNGIP